MVLLRLKCRFGWLSSILLSSHTKDFKNDIYSFSAGLQHERIVEGKSWKARLFYLWVRHLGKRDAFIFMWQTSGSVAQKPDLDFGFRVFCEFRLDREKFW